MLEPLVVQKCRGDPLYLELAPQFYLVVVFPVVLYLLGDERSHSGETLEVTGLVD